MSSSEEVLEAVVKTWQSKSENERKLDVLVNFIEEEGDDVEMIYEGHRKYING